MRRRAGITAAFLGLALLARAEPAGDQASVKAAEEAASNWLALVDAGDYAASWRQASSAFRKQISEEQWKAAVSSARAPFGKLLSRRLESAQYRTSLPGAPDGEYVVIQYGSSFERKKEAVETVTPMKDTDGAWRVSGYFVR